MRPRALPWLVLLAGALMLGFLVAPLLALAGALPSTRPNDLTQAETLGSLGTSLFAATVATLLDALLGIPLALWLARTPSRWRHLVTAVVLLPLGIPPVVGGLLLLLWLGPQGFLGDLSPVNTLAGTVAAQMFVAAPFVVISARAAFLAVDRAYEDAARSLGCTAGRAVWRVVVPLARRGLAAGLVLGWVRCLGEFGATAVVAYHPYTLPTLTFVRLTGEGIATALPAGTLLAVVGAASAAALIRLDAASRRRPHREQADGPAAATPLAWLGRQAADQGIEARIKLTLEGFRLEATFAAPGGVVAILGPSGAGKSLTLQSLTGLVRPDSGRLTLGSRMLFDGAQGIDLPPEERRMGYVAQRDTLFEHLDLEDNVRFGITRLSRIEQQNRLDELLTVLGLGRLRRAMPATLSGGERQRTALARALAPAPDALLLDEPLSGLDASLRRRLRAVMRGLFQRTRMPVVLVTHDRDDVLDLADHVVILEAGRVVQQGAVTDVFQRPARRSVAALVGIPNVLAVEALAPSSDGRVRVRTGWGELDIVAPVPPGGHWEVAVPADAIAVRAAGGGAVLRDVRPGLEGWRVVIESDGRAEPLEAMLPHAAFEAPPVAGTGCAVTIDGRRCHVMAAQSGHSA